MKKIKLSFSLKQLEHLMGLDERATIAQVTQDAQFDTVHVGLVVADELEPPWTEDDCFQVNEITQVGDALNNPDSYRQPIKGSIRGSFE